MGLGLFSLSLISFWGSFRVGIDDEKKPGVYKHRCFTI